MSTPEQEQILLDCLEAMAEAEKDAHNSGENSDDDVDDVALDHAYELACVRTEARERLLAMREDHDETVRRINVGSRMHGARSILTCA
jgi:hypothetical protein